MWTWPGPTGPKSNEIVTKLARDKIARTKVGIVHQDEQLRVRRLKQYVLARLREELGTAPRGAQAGLAKKLGVSGAHLSNMLSPRPTRQPGEDFRRKVAAHWGMTYAQLEANALGEEPPASSRLAVHDRVPPNLAEAISEYDWLEELPTDLRVVVREQARQYHRFGESDGDGEGQIEVVEWRRILAGLEREALGHQARCRQSRPVPRKVAVKARRRP